MTQKQVAPTYNLRVVCYLGGGVVSRLGSHPSGVSSVTQFRQRKTPVNLT